MDITSIQSRLVTTKSYEINNRTILFDKVTGYDNKIGFKELCNDHGLLCNIKYYFKIYLNNDSIEVSSSDIIWFNQHKNTYINKTLFGLIPYKKRVYDSEFWKRFSQDILCTLELYINSKDYNVIPYVEWLAKESETLNCYNYVKNIYQDFLEKFTEYKTFSS